MNYTCFLLFLRSVRALTFRVVTRRHFEIVRKPVRSTGCLRRVRTTHITSLVAANTSFVTPSISESVVR